MIVPDGLILAWLSYNDRPANDHGPLRLGFCAYVQEAWAKGATLKVPKGAHGYGATAEEAIANALANYNRPTSRARVEINLEDLEL